MRGFCWSLRRCPSSWYFITKHLTRMLETSLSSPLKDSFLLKSSFGFQTLPIIKKTWRELLWTIFWSTRRSLSRPGIKSITDSKRIWTIFWRKMLLKFCTGLLYWPKLGESGELCPKKRISYQWHSWYFQLHSCYFLWPSHAMCGSRGKELRIWKSTNRSYYKRKRINETK